MLLRRIIREESRHHTGGSGREMARRNTGAAAFGNTQLQEKTWPIETFFHKVVMLRNRLRTLEQQLNAAELPEDVKVKLQGYITRLLRIADQLQRAVRRGGRSVQGIGRRIDIASRRERIMGKHLDVVPFSGIIRIRDMMYSVERPVPARSGRRQLRRARHGQGGDAPRHRREPAATTCRRPAFPACSSSSPRSCAAPTASPSVTPTK